jgi:hypothetical protein
MGSSEPWYEELIAEHLVALSVERAARERAEAATEQWVQDADLQRLSYMAADARARRAEAENERLRAAVRELVGLADLTCACIEDWFGADNCGEVYPDDPDTWCGPCAAGALVYSLAALSPSTEGPTEEASG